jgi:hypothetical protein
LPLCGQIPGISNDHQENGILFVDRRRGGVGQGTYEYRPMGAAVIAASGTFECRDFSSRRRVETSRAARFLGQFASLGHLNLELAGQRRRRRVAIRRSRPG